MKRKSSSLTLSLSHIHRRRRRQDSMMAPPCNPQRFLNRGISSQLLSLLLAVTWLFSVTESAAPIEFTGEVGGSATIHCPSAEHRTIIFFYFQKTVNTSTQTFVNGYHTQRNISDVEGLKTWENTRVDYGKTTVDMYHLKISHGGDYQCLIWYSDSERPDKYDVRLSVTANYSKPKVTVLRKDDFSWWLTCDSYGGYPPNKMVWYVPGNPLWKVLNSSHMPVSATTVVNSSSTAYFNCSKGELKLLSCSVGDVTSDLFSVCTPEDPVYPYATIIATCVMVLLSVIATIFLLWCCSCKKGRRGAADLRQERGGNTSERELVAVLSEHNGGEEAP